MCLQMLLCVLTYHHLHRFLKAIFAISSGSVALYYVAQQPLVEKNKSLREQAETPSYCKNLLFLHEFPIPQYSFTCVSVMSPDAS